MSLDQPHLHEVAIPIIASSLDCSSSIDTGSPTLLIPESSLHDARSSLGSSHGTPAVKFAPLPQIDPNRKRSLVPLGVPGRSRRRPPIHREGGSLLWSTDPDVPEENMEDPIISFAKFVKKASKTLWRRVRKGSRAAAQDNVAHSVEPILDIRSAVRSGDMALGVPMPEAVGSEDKQERPASWSPSPERRTLSGDQAKRKSTSDLLRLPVSMVP